MPQQYIDYAEFNIWANQKIIQMLQKEDDGMLTYKFGGTASTIKSTILLIWDAEAGWLSRMKGKGWNSHKSNTFSGSNQELFDAWQATSIELRDFVKEVDLESEILFQSSGQNYTIHNREIIQTVFNHGSFFRGQIVLMMRLRGVSEITVTQYIEWVRIKFRETIDSYNL